MGFIGMLIVVGIIMAIAHGINRNDPEENRRRYEAQEKQKNHRKKLRKDKDDELERIDGLRRRYRIKSYNHIQRHLLKNRYSDTPERALALALLDGIDDAAEHGILDAEYKPS